MMLGCREQEVDCWIDYCNVLPSGGCSATFRSAVFITEQPAPQEGRTTSVDDGDDDDDDEDGDDDDGDDGDDDGDGDDDDDDGG